MRRFYFTSESHADGDNPANDHIGNIRGARTLAQKVANELGETVYINDCETNDIVDCIDPDSILDDVSDFVENETTLTLDEINYLIVLLSMEIDDNENTIKRFENFSIDCSDIISNCKLVIDKDRIIYDKLFSLYCSIKSGGAEE